MVPILHKVPYVSKSLKSTPLCHPCKYFDNGSCKLFFAINYTHERVKYIKVSDARTDNSLCGPDGKYYTEK